jgi:hypothetical protein
MPSIEGYVDYAKREYCRAVPCPIQTLLDQAGEGTDRYASIRAICKDDCLHTTHAFHSWLIKQGYLIVRPQDNCNP